MTHPIDPLTPEVLTARILWDAAVEENIIRFLGVWERMEAGHTRELEIAYENGQSDAGSFDRGYDEGVEDGYNRGFDEGWMKAKAEKDEQPPSTS